MRGLLAFIFALFAFGTCNAALTIGCMTGYYNTDNGCVKCPDGTTTPMPYDGILTQNYTQCAPAWLRYQHTPSETGGLAVLGPTTKAIPFNLEKQTTPALAMRVGNKTMYAAMARATTQKSGELYIKYNNQTYHILESAPESKFQITTTSTTKNFTFTMSAAGTFYVDWGDGTVDEIIRTNTTNTTYGHTYATTGARTIKMSGAATGYSTDDTTAAISFSGNTNIAKINGSLGAVFSTIERCTTDLTGLCNMNLPTKIEQPRFFETFRYCTGLASIPENLFDGIRGAPTGYMFAGTFGDCSGLTTIPENLFGGISGAPAEYMFWYTFQRCTGVTNIPENLFAGIRGAPASNMFRATFDTVGITSIPANLFSGIEGAPAEHMYYYTFTHNAGITSIPDGLFGNLYGAPAYEMFAAAFYDCPNLNGPTARTANGMRLYDVMYNGQTWYQQMPNAFIDMYKYTSVNTNN